MKRFFTLIHSSRELECFCRRSLQGIRFVCGIDYTDNCLFGCFFFPYFSLPKRQQAKQNQITNRRKLFDMLFSGRVLRSIRIKTLHNFIYICISPC